jgi:hypothetical protein
MLKLLTATAIASVIVGGCILGGAYMTQQSLVSVQRSVDSIASQEPTPEGLRSLCASRDYMYDWQKPAECQIEQAILRRRR